MGFSPRHHHQGFFPLYSGNGCGLKKPLRQWPDDGQNVIEGLTLPSQGSRNHVKTCAESCEIMLGLGYFGWVKTVWVVRHLRWKTLGDVSTVPSLRVSQISFLVDDRGEGVIGGHRQETVNPDGALNNCIVTSSSQEVIVSPIAPNAVKQSAQIGPVVFVAQTKKYNCTGKA